MKIIKSIIITLFYVVGIPIFSILFFVFCPKRVWTSMIKFLNTIDFKRVRDEDKSPQVIVVENNSNQAQTAVLFGANQYMQSVNLGNDPSIWVRTDGDREYKELLYESQHNPFYTSLIKIESDNHIQIHQNWSYYLIDANGDMQISRIIPQNYLSPYQDDPKIIEMNRNILISGNSEIKFTMLANSKMRLTIWKAKTVLLQSLLQKVFKELMNSIDNIDLRKRISDAESDFKKTTKVIEGELSISLPKGISKDQIKIYDKRNAK